jgi:cysteine desulfurase
MSVYLDHNATTPVRPEAAEAVARGLALGGNPSSVHAAGRKARAVVEDARAAVAALAGASPASVTFTSGGTEANALAIESAVAAGLDRLLVLATDHDSVLESARATGAPLHLWPVDGGGVADLDWLAARLDEGGRPLVAVAWANHETGVVQPIAEIAERVRAAGGWLHVDAVQAASKRPLSWTEVAADTLSLSAHKLGGPQGVGALVAGPRAVLSRRLHGGGQERGVRAGTENVPGIAGFGAAALHAAPLSAQAPWRDAAAERLVREAGAVVLGAGAERLEHVLCLAAEGFPSELQVMLLDLAGVQVSAGSACSSGKVKASRVVAAMGREDLAPYALRVSGGWSTTEADWARFADAWLDAWRGHTRRRAA